MTIDEKIAAVQAALEQGISFQQAARQVTIDIKGLRKEMRTRGLPTNSKSTRTKLRIEKVNQEIDRIFALPIRMSYRTEKVLRAYQKCRTSREVAARLGLTDTHVRGTLCQARKILNCYPLIVQSVVSGTNVTMINRKLRVRLSKDNYDQIKDSIQ